jgi:hypothetical protein
LLPDGAERRDIARQLHSGDDRMIAGCWPVDGSALARASLTGGHAEDRDYQDA